ncbi:MAG TPA: proprotein convertase P-domain-containing protein [Flavisolibacter sp.]
MRKVLLSGALVAFAFTSYSGSGPARIPGNNTGFNPVKSVNAPFRDQTVLSTDIIQSSGALNLAIPDDDATGISSVLAIAGAPVNAIIDSVVVTFSITHTWLEDVEVNLQAPNGQIINLVADRGEGSIYGCNNTRVSSVNTEAVFPSGAYASPLTGTYRADATAQVNLIASTPVTTSTFSSLFSVINGNWMLRVYDDQGADDGTLIQWSVKISYSPGAPLPAAITTFSGLRSGTSNILSWTTQTEQNNSGFDVQRSSDGMDFRSIAFIPSAAAGGSSAQSLRYNFTDDQLQGAYQYYRLRQVDLDGRHAFSNVIMIRDGAVSGTRLHTMFPNPVHDVLNVQVESPGSGTAVLEVADFSGNMISRSSRRLEKGANALALPTAHLPAGVYLLVIRQDERIIQAEKFIKL